VRNDKRRADMRMVQRTGQQLVNNLAIVNGLEPPKFVMADDSGLEMSRAQRDSILLPVLAGSGLCWRVVVCGSLVDTSRTGSTYRKKTSKRKSLKHLILSMK